MKAENHTSANSCTHNARTLNMPNLLHCIIHFSRWSFAYLRDKLRTPLMNSVFNISVCETCNFNTSTKLVSFTDVRMPLQWGPSSCASHYRHPHSTIHFQLPQHAAGPTTRSLHVIRASTGDGDIPTMGGITSYSDQQQAEDSGA